ncbi:NADH-quinone oxidoreductase subunit K [Bradyrhizobium diazoefficiens]
MPTSTHTTTEPSPSSGPRKRSVNAVSKAAVSLSSDSGCYGLITKPQPLRKIIAFNLLGSGVFLLFGVVGRRGAAAGIGNDPVPQALVITGIVVAFSATALAIALLLRLFQTSASMAPRSRASPRDDPDQAGG